MYYVGRNGQQSGPYPVEELQKMASASQLSPADLVWTDGMSEWKPAGTALADLFAPAAAASVVPPPAPQMGSVQPPPPPAAPAYAASALPAGPAVSTYLWQSIAVTLCCCLPFGIPAIIYASQVDSKRQTGDLAGALDSSSKARMWCWIAFIIGLGFSLISVALGTFKSVLESSQH